MTGHMRPTLETVADLAGVSRATVSRVVNGSTSVSPDLRDTVLRAVRTLGYVPNRAARGLVTQCMDAYALVLAESAERIFSEDPFFSTLVSGAAHELAAAGKELVLHLASSQQSLDRVRDAALSGHVDGVMVVSMCGAEELAGTLAAQGVPVVVNGRPLGLSPVPYVDVANVDAARSAVRRLVDSGRRRIATIAGPQTVPGAIDRLTGYRAEMRHSRLPPAVAVGDFTYSSASSAMRRLLTDHPRLDAVFVASDLMAHAAMQVLRLSGRQVPSDVAVIGFDDTEPARYAEPPLTTVRLPVHEIGSTMARQVMRMARGERIERSVLLSTEFVVRESA
ncbi:LacI family DNA-binding transcriptional regulator [Actinoplanes sp. NEAU-A12]|uniref:LacI family DNA-binding transcriptional regulator n=1 Tax=Actinoplanes sandaracinus TaxID=3045177 RepID=A0ABT6WWR1_9ACTN|nr:LacI family DNA-binding transcriptional regulator [Actinoplanes sandaracinus]MDI6104186.1 LacI family DNA-binding transcriptional regulator [Actinoplanes sandaracinus]